MLRAINAEHGASLLIRALRLVQLKSWAEADHPRDSRGQFTDGAGDSVSPRSRAERAIASHKPSTRAVQRRAFHGERVVADIVGGRSLDDNEPMDLIVRSGGRIHGVEVKTLIHNTNDKITMHPASRRRKEAWVRQNRAKGHTVVVDKRGSGVSLYYKSGFGAFRISSMQKVTASELRKLVRS